MAPRLLSLLSSIESALANHGSDSVARGRPTRTVNFHKGLARMTFSDGSGSILLQGFTLADGQICVKALLEWTGASQPGVQAIYPTENFNWAGAAFRVAEAWMDGPAEQAVQETQPAASEENLAATG